MAESYRVATGEPVLGIYNYQPPRIEEEKSYDRRLDSYRVATVEPSSGLQARSGSMSTVQSEGTQVTQTTTGNSQMNLFSSTTQQRLGLESCGWTKDSFLWFGFALLGIGLGLFVGLMCHFLYVKPTFDSVLGKHVNIPPQRDVIGSVVLENFTHLSESDKIQFVTREIGALRPTETLYDYKEGLVVIKDISLNLCFIYSMLESELNSHTNLIKTLNSNAEFKEDPKTFQVVNYAPQDRNYTAYTLDDALSIRVDNNMFITDLCNDTVGQWFMDRTRVSDTIEPESKCFTCLPRYNLEPFPEYTVFEFHMKSVDCPKYGFCP